MGRLEEWKTGRLAKAQARWQSWREEREQRPHAAERGRVPAIRQETLRRNRLEKRSIEEPTKTFAWRREQYFQEPDRNRREEDKETKDTARKTPIFVLTAINREEAAKKAGEPKIAKATRITNFLLFPASRGRTQSKLDEDELKLRAARLKQNALNLTCKGRDTN